MRLFRIIKTASPEANFLALLSGSILFVKVLILDEIPAPYAALHKMGIFVEAILASVVASYVFYLVVVHLKELSDKDTLKPYIGKHSTRIVAECSTQLNDLSKASGVTLAFNSTDKEEIERALKQIPPYSGAPLVLDQAGTQANWLQYFEHHRQRTLDSIRKLLDKLLYLNTSHVRIISEVEECSHFYVVSVIQGIQTRNSDLSFMSSSLFSYVELCRELDKHNTKGEW